MNKRTKYPRTFHLPWSEGRTDDDKTLRNCDAFSGKEVVVTEKRDGENTTLYRDGLHARSIDSRHHPSRDWVKGLQGRIGYQIPPGWRVCGENLYARHSVPYTDLKTYFEAFSVWDGSTCLSWDETVMFCEDLGLDVVPVLYTGTFSEAMLRELSESMDTESCEGFVVRLRDEFEITDFKTSVAKWVRKNHVQTDGHWMYSEITPNTLRG